MISIHDFPAWARMQDNSTLIVTIATPDELLRVVAPENGDGLMSEMVFRERAKLMIDAIAAEIDRRIPKENYNG